MSENLAKHEKLKLDEPVCFITLAGQPLAARLQQIRLSTEEVGATVCSIRLELEWATYLAVAAGRWFGLQPVVSDGIQTVSFEPGRPVELHALLHQGVAQSFINEATGCEDIAVALVQDQTTESGIRLNISENWLAAEIKQQVTLPESLAGEGKLKQGYRTLWAEPAGAGAVSSDAHEAEAARSMHETVDGLLREWAWSFERNDADLLTLRFQGASGEWTVLILTEEEKQLCIVYSVFPAIIPPERRADALEWISRINYELPIGSFELDATDGELRFRSGLDTEGTWLSQELLSNLLSTNLAVMDLYFLELANVAEQR
jgi:hypothetical protein